MAMSWGKTLQSPSCDTLEIREYLSCCHGMTKVILKAAEYTIQSVLGGSESALFGKELEAFLSVSKMPLPWGCALPGWPSGERVGLVTWWL